jgi:hypothetical protein
MSLVGVASGSYEHLSQCGELIDKVLLALHSKTSSPSDPERKLLAHLLQEVGGSAPGDIQTLRFTTLLRRLSQGSEQKWIELGKALLSLHLSATEISLLEDLAEKVEVSRTEVAGRLRGETR